MQTPSDNEGRLSGNEDSLTSENSGQPEELQSDPVLPTVSPQRTSSEQENRESMESQRSRELQENYEVLRETVPSTQNTQADCETVLEHARNYDAFLMEKKKKEREYINGLQEIYEKISQFAKKMGELENLPRDEKLKEVARIEKEFGSENLHPIKLYERMLANLSPPNPSTYAEEFKALNPIVEEGSSQENEESPGPEETE